MTAIVWALKGLTGLLPKSSKLSLALCSCVPVMSPAVGNLARFSAGQMSRRTAKSNDEQTMERELRQASSEQSRRPRLVGN
jgi:hypothetical protein